VRRLLAWAKGKRLPAATPKLCQTVCGLTIQCRAGKFAPVSARVACAADTSRVERRQRDSSTAQVVIIAQAAMAQPAAIQSSAPPWVDAQIRHLRQNLPGPAMRQARVFFDF